MSRVLAVPALLCLVLGAVLGVWGWGARDEARARIIPEVPSSDDGFFDTGSVVDPARLAQVCGVLRAASLLQLPDPATVLVPGQEDPLATTVPAATAPTTTAAPSPDELASSLVALLDPSLVYGIPGLDRMDVYVAITSERDAIEVARASGRDITADTQVLTTAQQLGLALDGSC